MSTLSHGHCPPRVALEPPSIDDVRQNFTILDRVGDTMPQQGVLVCYEDYSAGDRLCDQVVPLPRLLAFIPNALLLRDFLFACNLLWRTRGNAVLIANGGHRLGQVICVLNYFLGRWKRRILLFELYPESASPLKRRVLRWMVLGSSLCVVFSRVQIRLQAEYLDVPENRFVFVPYKANHSQSQPIAIVPGNYVFSGGNTKRDYATLCEAVRGTGIPVMISATDPAVIRGLNVPSNVIILSAVEPSFAKLMAGSRFVVITINAGGVRGAGEASACNAMWHGKAVVCADDLSASDHIIDGVTGYIVPAGDALELKARILQLWEDTEGTQNMGRRAHEHVAASLTHEHFLRRLLALSDLLSCYES